MLSVESERIDHLRDELMVAGGMSGLVAIGVDGTPRFIAAGVRTAYHTAFRTCSANGY